MIKSIPDALDQALKIFAFVVFEECRKIPEIKFLSIYVDNGPVRVLALDETKRGYRDDSVEKLDLTNLQALQSQLDQIITDSSKLVACKKVRLFFEAQLTEKGNFSLKARITDALVFQAKANCYTMADSNLTFFNPAEISCILSAYPDKINDCIKGERLLSVALPMLVKEGFLLNSDFITKRSIKAWISAFQANQIEIIADVPFSNFSTLSAIDQLSPGLKIVTDNKQDYDFFNADARLAQQNIRVELVDEYKTEFSDQTPKI